MISFRTAFSSPLRDAGSLAFRLAFRLPTATTTPQHGQALRYATAAAKAKEVAAKSRRAAAKELFDRMRQQVMHSSRENTGQMRTYKPRTPGLRHLRRPINDHLWKGRPHLPLTFPKIGHGKGGRNRTGRVTVRHRGGGARRRIRTVDFFRWHGGPHVVDRIEYDPNRSAHLALLTQQNTGKKSYVIAADGMEAGDVVYSYRSGIPRPMLDSMGGVIDPGVLASKTCFRGNCLPVHLIPINTLIYNIGTRAKGPAVFCRSAGTYAVILSKGEETNEDGIRVTSEGTIAIRLQSGEVRSVSRNACATIGVASNPNHHHRQLGKAGRSRWLNIRPSVRGVAMNRIDHPHGGGRGKSKSNKHPTSPWGTPSKGGYKTRRRKDVNDFVIVPRPRGSAKKRRDSAEKEGKKKKKA